MGKTSNCIFNDTWILNLSLLTWSKIQPYGEPPDRRYNFCSTLVGTQLVVFGGLNGKTYNSAGLFICELEHMKALKQVMTNGKKKAYFEDSPANRSTNKLSKKARREQEIMERIKRKPPVQLTKIQMLEKQLREGNSYAIFIYV